jgi:hypothetical protein
MLVSIRNGRVATGDQLPGLRDEALAAIQFHAQTIFLGVYHG